MLENPALLSRLMFFIALVCAAVMSFIMSSDAAGASPIPDQVHNEQKHNVLRRFYNPYSQHHPLSTGLPSAETELLSGTNSETETSRDYTKALSIIDHQSNPLQFTDGNFGYNQNILDNRWAQAGIMGMQSEVRSASSIFTSHPQYGGQSFERRQFRENYHPLSQEVPQSGISYYSHPVIIRKSPLKEPASPFHQSSRASQVWGPRDAQKSSNREKLPINYSPKVAEDETVWQRSDTSLFSSQTGRYSSTSLPTSRGHYNSYKETNELAVVRPRSTSSGIQSRRFFGIASQTAPHAPSISNDFAASVIKSNPNPEKLTSSFTDFSQGPHSASSNETPRYKKVQSFLFKDSQTSSGGRETVSTVTGDGHGASYEQRPSDPQVHSWFSSNLKQLQQSKNEEPTKQVQHLSDNANPLYRNTYVAQYGAQTDSIANYQDNTAETVSQMSVHPVPGTDNTKKSVVPVPHADFQDSYITGNEKPVVGSLVNISTSGTVHSNKPGQTIQNIYGFRGFKNPIWRASKEPSVRSSSGSYERTNSQQSSFDKGKFKIANKYPSLSQKYSFGQRGAPTTPAKLELTPTDYSSPSPSTSENVKTTTTTSGFKETQPLLPKSDSGMDSNQDGRQFKIYRKIYGLKGFTTRPQEGAKQSVSEPEKSARVHQSFAGFKLRSPQIRKPTSNRIHWWHNKTESGSSHVAAMNQNEQNSEDLKPLLMTAGSKVTRFTPDKYNKNRKLYTHMGFHPIQERIGHANNQTHWTHSEENPSPASSNDRISSAYFRSTGDLNVETRPKSETRMPNKTKPVAMLASLLNSSTNSMVIGKRVRGKHINGKKLNDSTSLTTDAGNVPILRLPKRPARVKAVMYADILGSASFTGVRATTQTPNTKATKQEAKAGQWTINSEDAVHTRNSTNKGPKDEGEDFRSVEENKSGVGSEKVDSEMKNSDFFLDNEGSGSGALNMSDVFSADTTKTERLGEDLLELDYLRISTGNISFKSMKLSHTEK